MASTDKKVAVITSEIKNSTGTFYEVFAVSKEMVASSKYTVDANNIIGLVSSGSVTPLNFGIENGKITQKCGVFKRLKDSNGVSPRILIAEMVTESDRIIGYVLMDKVGNISKVSRKDVYSLCDKAQKLGVAFLQNGIYKNMQGTPSISCYPNCKFPKIVLHVSKKEKVKPAQPVKVPSQKKVATNKELGNVQTEKYTREQLVEIGMARKNGVNEKIILNPKLSPEQMRVIWFAKLQGVPSEYFANPKFSADIMKFLADIIIDKKIFMELRRIINPKYSFEQLNELYIGLVAGADYSLYADEALTPEEMHAKRYELEMKLFDKSDYDEIQNRFYSSLTRGKKSLKGYSDSEASEE